MNQGDSGILQKENILYLSLVILIAAISFYCAKDVSYNNKPLTIVYESFNTQTISPVKVAIKKPSANNIFTAIVSSSQGRFEAVNVETTAAKKDEQPKVETLSKPVGPTWRLPTEWGYITQYESYNHTALDITSSRGTNERIYPVADGVISSIYHDNYGAKIVTVNHNINGKHYSSQYVHLSWFAPNIYVGKQVTTNDYLGGMGATGYATGIHLHITVLDCNLFDPNDPYCSTLNGFFNYARVRHNQGYRGLRSEMNVPYVWYSR